MITSDLDKERLRERHRDRDLPWDPDPDLELCVAFLCRTARTVIAYSQIALGCRVTVGAGPGVVARPQARDRDRVGIRHRHLSVRVPTRLEPDDLGILHTCSHLSKSNKKV